MTIKFFGRSLFFILCTGIILLSTACSSISLVRGRVIDAETQKPIAGAAVAIRWLENSPGQNPVGAPTLDAAQDLSDSVGTFTIPEYSDRTYVLGVYKQGYVCWSSRDIFLNNNEANDQEKYKKRSGHRIENGMEIKLEPFDEGYSRKRHAGFAVMVAGECTNTHSGAFNQAIKSEYKLWRKTLREDFLKRFKGKYSFKKQIPSKQNPIEPKSEIVK